MARANTAANGTGYMYFLIMLLQIEASGWILMCTDSNSAKCCKTDRTAVRSARRWIMILSRTSKATREFSQNKETRRFSAAKPVSWSHPGDARCSFTAEATESRQKRRGAASEAAVLTKKKLCSESQKSQNCSIRYVHGFYTFFHILYLIYL